MVCRREMFIIYSFQNILCYLEVSYETRMLSLLKFLSLVLKFWYFYLFQYYRCCCCCCRGDKRIHVCLHFP